MIHHFSIAADQPLHVAQVLAELWNGEVGPFPPNPGSYLVLAMDEYGTMIEVYPRGTEITPGVDENEQAGFQQNPLAASLTATHAAISVPVSLEQIERIAAREGWRSLYCSREGLFELVELWIENKLMIELLTPAMTKRYLEFMQPESLKAFFAAAPTA